MEIVIRKATPEDEEGIQLVSKQALAFLRKFYAPSPTAKKIGSESSCIRLVAINENSIIGTVTFDEDGQALYFGGLGILEEYRGRGVLRIMLEHLEQIAKGGSFRKLICATVLETGNVQIFEKLGFQVVSAALTNKFIGLNGQPVTEVRLEKLVK